MHKTVTTTDRRATQELLDVVDRLTAEFPEQPAGVVIAQVVRARQRQRRELHSDSHLIADIERAARQRILSASPA